ncbi:hypothetical protein C1646_774828 [Rhizophagus diaphanus]|nr:hypothetical protein C1646_774828 [Rhizophagus diaphanus] [Rhizophagus sp. MUCL 43196]
MESLFIFYLKRRTTVNIDWYQLFVKWDKQESSLIELHNELHIMYTENYKFNIQELRAWNTFLHAVSAHNVTPWSNDDEYQQFELFFSTKEHVNMSSYKTDSANGKRFVYKEDLGGLCSQCNECGYQVFANIKELININITDLVLQNELIVAAQNL